MKQIARNVTMADWGFLSGQKYSIHDRDSKFSSSFRAIIKAAGVDPLKLPARSPTLNARGERWVRSVKEECLSKVILFGKEGLRTALREYVSHYREERNHQGKGNVALFPSNHHNASAVQAEGLECSERLGGLLKFYYRKAA